VVTGEGSPLVPTFGSRPLLDDAFRRPLDHPLTSAFTLVMGASAHAWGWPFAEGGSQSLAAALVEELERRGGTLQTGQMVAALQEIAQATFASKVEIDGGKATVTREVDAGLETLEVDLPAVITTDLRLNEPRYLKLPDIMKAKKKPIETVSLADLDVTPPAIVKTTKTAPPPARSKGIMVKTVDELVDALKSKGLL